MRAKLQVNFDPDFKKNNFYYLALVNDNWFSLVSLNKKTASFEQELEIGGCSLGETREGLGTWPSSPALGKCAEEDIYLIEKTLSLKSINHKR